MQTYVVMFIGLLGSLLNSNPPELCVEPNLKLSFSEPGSSLWVFPFWTVGTGAHMGHRMSDLNHGSEKGLLGDVGGLVLLWIAPSWAHHPTHPKLGHVMSSANLSSLYWVLIFANLEIGACYYVLLNLNCLSGFFLASFPRNCKTAPTIFCIYCWVFMGYWINYLMY